MLFMAGSVECFLACESFDWLGRLLERFAAGITGRVRDRVDWRAPKFIF